MFFKYQLHTPMVREIPPWEHALYKPAWYGAGSTKLADSFTVVMQPVFGSDGTLGLQKLKPNSISAMRDFLIQPKEASLAEDLLSDAQSAWYEGNLRRAVLELAICAEVIVKRKFFAKATAAGAAFDYFEDKSKIAVRVTELLDAVAKEAFARSYRVEAPDKFQCIDSLFRCRNKVAHRGDLSFRDDKGALIQVDEPLVASWWDATSHLMKWLDAIP